MFDADRDSVYMFVVLFEIGIVIPLLPGVVTVTKEYISPPNWTVVRDHLLEILETQHALPKASSKQMHSSYRELLASVKNSSSLPMEGQGTVSIPLGGVQMTL